LTGTVYPNPDRVSIYQKKYETYCAFRDALDPVWGRMAK